MNPEIESYNDIVSLVLNTPPTPLAWTMPALPQALDTITGVPAIKASDTTAPQPSCSLGKTNKSALVISCLASFIVNLPAQVMFAGIFLLDKLVSSFFKGPVPTTFK